MLTCRDPVTHVFKTAFAHILARAHIQSAALASQSRVCMWSFWESHLEHFIVPTLAADIQGREAHRFELTQLIDGFGADIPWKAVGGDPLHPRHMLVDERENGYEAVDRQHHRVAVPQKDSVERMIAIHERCELNDLAFDEFDRLEAKFLGLGRVHLAKSAPIPRAAIGDCRSREYCQAQFKLHQGKVQWA